jgi:hypothetical protein
MEFSIQPYQDQWLVFRDGVAVFSGDYRQVEHWLDHAENSARCSQRVPPQADRSGQTLPTIGKSDARSVRAALPVAAGGSARQRSA